ncbi:MAG: Gfo/Idh/MocA family protein [Acidimicrobiia bacterium]
MTEVRTNSKDGVVRFGVLGAADIGRKVVPGIQASENCRVDAVASRTLAKAEAYAAELSIPRAYGGYDELLADPNIDAVYIPLPNDMHAEWSIAAVRAGKHVLCEKPLAMNASEAASVMKAASDADRYVVEAFMYRLHPSWKRVKEIVDSGEIGELSTVQSFFSYFNDDPENIRNRVASGGGALYDVGCYSINLSRFLFGTEPIVESATIQRDETGTDVVTSAILSFGEGTATFTCSTRLEDDQRVHIYGAKGRISIEIPFNIPPDQPSRISISQGGNLPSDPGIVSETFEPADPYACQANAFADLVLGNAGPAVPIGDGVLNMAVIDAVFAAG